MVKRHETSLISLQINTKFLALLTNTLLIHSCLQQFVFQNKINNSKLISGLVWWNFFLFLFLLPNSRLNKQKKDLLSNPLSCSFRKSACDMKHVMQFLTLKNYKYSNVKQMLKVQVAESSLTTIERGRVPFSFLNI
jgi:hypothetical protein